MRQYIAIDLKSFYASVEAVERKLNPLDVNLVVADESRTEKTICLAVTPSLKVLGVSGRPRLFEVVQKVREINNARRYKAPGRRFSGKSYFGSELKENPALEVDYIVAQPRMRLYIDYSTRIYQVYLRYIAPEDICVYSIDEVFIDATPYLATYNMTASELAMKMIKEVLADTGITATAGIGTNLYLSKIAMDIKAKHTEQDESGVRLAELDEISYRKEMWAHKPIRDFWRVGKGYAKKLEKYLMFTMGDVAKCSLNNEDLLYRLFGVNAELLIDHAWGWEPCRMADIRAYKPASNSISSGQVLQKPYPYEKAKLIAWEMAESMALDLVAKSLVTDQVVLTVGYDVENLANSVTARGYRGEVVVDFYGRKKPKHAHGTGNIGHFTSSGKKIVQTVIKLFERIVDKNLSVRRVTLCVNHVLNEELVADMQMDRQIDLFADYGKVEDEQEKYSLAKERSLQEAVLTLKKRFGRNAVLKAKSLLEDATAISRNQQFGGHNA